MEPSSKNLLSSLIKARASMTSPEKDKSGRFGKYTSLEALVKCVVPPLLNNDIMLTHTIENNLMITTLVHLSGEKMSNSFPLTKDAETVWGVAGAVTYAKRYGICALLCICGDDDDDGENAQEASVKKVAEKKTDQKSERKPVELPKIVHGAPPTDVQTTYFDAGLSKRGVTKEQFYADYEIDFPDVVWTEVKQEHLHDMAAWVRAKYPLPPQ